MAANLEDMLAVQGLSIEGDYPCDNCGVGYPPFALSADRICSTCEIEQARADLSESGPPLDEVRAGKRALITQWRNDRDGGGAITPLGIMDSDPVSIVKITGAVQMAQVTTDFTIEWTMLDNSLVTHDAAAMIAAGVAVGEHIAANHAISCALKAQVDDATTLAEVEAVTWPE